MHLSSQKTMRARVVSLLTVAILVIALLASIGMMQTNNANAAGNIIYKERLKENFAYAQKTIEEGSITTQVFAEAFKTTSGDTGICVGMTKYDSSTDTYPTDFGGCDPASQLTIANNLNSATFSGTITGFDHATGEEKTVTVNVDLTATGKAQTGTFGFRFVTPDFKVVSNENGRHAPASGSLNISGDLTFSTDDATGQIAKVRQGSILVQKV
jgi:hypothetical protein